MRSRVLVRWLMEWVEANDDGVLVTELIQAASMLRGRSGERQWSEKTVDNVIGDLCAFGALRKVQRGRDRFVCSTILGRAWLAGVRLPELGDVELGAVVCALLGRPLPRADEVGG